MVRGFLLSLAQDIATNIWTFLVIVCNHSGKDLYSSSCRPNTAEFFLRSVHSSANFPGGNDFLDLCYGWLNYQVEHHMFPDLSPLQYRKMQPLVEEVCKKYGVKYTMGSCFTRCWDLIQI